MKKIIMIVFILGGVVTYVTGQTKKVELYDLIERLVPDSGQSGAIGDWAIGKTATYPVSWESDKLVLSNDEKILFFRKGTADIFIKGNRYQTEGKPSSWNVMLKGPKSGYSSFSITSTASKSFAPGLTLDSLFGKKILVHNLLKRCDYATASGFNYYEVKLPKKLNAFIKLSWKCDISGCAIGIDVYDDLSKQHAELECPRLFKQKN